MAWFQVHHIISQQFSGNPTVQMLANNNLFDIQSSQNLVDLPSSRILAAILDVSPHNGGHLSSYYDGIENFLDAQNAPNLSPQDVSNNVNQFVDAVRLGLLTGQVYTNTPLGWTPEQTN